MNYEQLKTALTNHKNLQEGVVVEVHPDGQVIFINKDGGWVGFEVVGHDVVDTLKSDDFRVFENWIEIEDVYVEEYYMFLRNTSDDHDIKSMDIYPEVIYDSENQMVELYEWFDTFTSEIKNSPWLGEFFKNS